MINEETVNKEENINTSLRAPNWKRRLWRYLPLLIWLGFIFFASTGEMSASNTSRIIRPLLLWLFPHISEATIEFVHLCVRKSSHFTEYAILALLAARAFTGSSVKFLSNHWFLSALLLAAVYSLTDEFHQSFVASRTASIYDSMIDTSGGLTALIILALWRWRKRRRENKNQTSKDAEFVR